MAARPAAPLASTARAAAALLLLLLLLRARTADAAIPRIIHRFYSGGQRAMRAAASEPTSSFKLYWIKSCETHHPGWETRHWDDKSVLALVRRDFPWFLKTYRSYRQAVQRSDAARWLILYTYGGVYIDNDVECFRSMEPTLAGLDLALNCELTLPPGKVGNAVQASAAGHPVWLRIIEEGMRRAAAVRPGAPVTETLDVTGPHLTEWGVKTLHNLTMGDEVCGVELRGPGGRVSYAYRLGEWFTPCQWNDGNCHADWARRAFSARRGGEGGGSDNGGGSDGAGAAAPPPPPRLSGAASVVGAHKYASTWTDGASATAHRMRAEARESWDEAAKLLSDPARFVEYACAAPLFAGGPPANAGANGHPFACAEFVDDAVAAGACSVVVIAGDPDNADFAPAAALRRRGCRVTAVTPGGGVPAAIENAAAAAAGPDGGDGGNDGGANDGGDDEGELAPAFHVRAYLGPTAALVRDPPVVPLPQALRMAWRAGAAHGGGGGGGNGGHHHPQNQQHARPRGAFGTDDDEPSGSGDDGSGSSEGGAASHAAAPRHSVLHISCGGCEWDTFHAVFEAAAPGDALSRVELLLLDTPGPVPSDYRALSLYALLYQEHGFVGYAHYPLGNSGKSDGGSGGASGGASGVRMAWVRAPWRAQVRAAVLGGGNGNGAAAAAAAPASHT